MLKPFDELFRSMILNRFLLLNELMMDVIVGYPKKEMKEKKIIIINFLH